MIHVKDNGLLHMEMPFEAKPERVDVMKYNSS